MTTRKTRTVADPPTNLYRSLTYFAKVASRTYRHLARVFLNRRSSLPNPTLLLLATKNPQIAQPHLVLRATVLGKAAILLVVDALEGDGLFWTGFFHRLVGSPTLRLRPLSPGICKMHLHVEDVLISNHLLRLDRHPLPLLILKALRLR